LELAVSAPLTKVNEEGLHTKAAVDADANCARTHKERSARHYTGAGYAWHFHATGTVDDRARFVKVFGPIVNQFSMPRTPKAAASRARRTRSTPGANWLDGRPETPRRHRRTEGEEAVVEAAAARPRPRTENDCTRV
jgi:hypothetical protein